MLSSKITLKALNKKNQKTDREESVVRDSNFWDVAWELIYWA